MLLLQLGKREGLRLSDEQFKDWLTTSARSRTSRTTQKFKEALAAGRHDDGRSAQATSSASSLSSACSSDEVGRKLQITEEEARQYYLAHQTEFIEAATVTLREIVIEVPTRRSRAGQASTSAKDDEAQKKAEAVRARVMAGEDFAKVAAEVSASASKANGGLIGPIA